MTRIVFGLLLVPFLTSIASCRAEALREIRHTIPVGDDSVGLIVHESGAPGLHYVILHDDENTAVEAAIAHVEQAGGRVFELRHSGSRNVRFTLGGTEYRFDPNRAFTQIGAAHSLERWSEAPVTNEALHAVRAFADSLYARLMEGAPEPLVAVHNNTDDGYSVLSYQPGGELAGEARTTYVSGDADPDDFVFTTSADLYHRARDAGLHAVLQRMPLQTDDGSLSVLAAQRRFSYVNVEAEHGHLEIQLRMLTLMTKKD